VNGAKLARLRLAKGWSQQRLAVEAGVHVMTVSSAERGAKEPLLATVEALARALDVPIPELLKPEPEEATA
jgi:transcriptional regulator with XRE-family HTH domain